MTGTPRKARFGEVSTWLAWVIAQETDECIPWPFLARSGSQREYGLVAGSSTNNGKKTQTVQSFVCTAEYGPCPEGEEARHHCGFGLCANKRHLGWAAHRVNEKDKVRHGTSTIGERNGMYGRTFTRTLTADSLADMQRDLKDGELTQAAISRKYGVSPQRVWQIKNGIHVPG